MSVRVLWWAPFGVIVIGAALLGLRYGWVAATTTETEVILRYARQYVEDHGTGAQLTDCMATPDDSPRIWMVISCMPVGARQSYDYYVNRLGGFEYGAWPAANMVTELQI